MPPFVAKENFVTTLWTELGSRPPVVFFGCGGLPIGLASSLSSGFEGGLGTDYSCREPREPGA